MQLARWDAQTLLEKVTGIEEIQAPADIRNMGGTGHEGYQFAAIEDRRDDAQVGQVPGAKPGIVRDQHVAGDQVLGGKDFQQMLDGDRQVNGERRRTQLRLGQAAALTVQHDDGEVPALADNGGEGRADQRDVHLVHDGDQAAPLDLDGDRVELRRSSHLRGPHWPSATGR